MEVKDHKRALKSQNLMWTFHCFGKLSVERMVGVKFGRLQVVWCGQEVCQGIAMCKIFFGMMCQDLVNGENRLLWEGKV